MIQSMIGCVGMGEVYQALDTQRAHTNWINSSMPGRASCGALQRGQRTGEPVLGGCGQRSQFGVEGSSVKESSVEVRDALL
jgi:hypothetical protein